MVYIHFPAHLTDEEEVLMKKYAKLKKKKRMLQSIRAQQKQDPKKDDETPKKRSSEEAANATEQAKKLLKAGAIKVGYEKKESQGFKKSKKQKDSEKSAVGYQPFSASQESDKEKVLAGYTPFQSSLGARPDSTDDRTEPGVSHRKPLYESFLSSSDRIPGTEREPRRERERGGRDSFRDRSRDKDRRKGPRVRDEDLPTKGKTVYVSGDGITKDLLQRTFSRIGDILNISMEDDRSIGFVAFEKMKYADEAIAKLNGAMVEDVHLHVSLARHQPEYEPAEDKSSSTWASCIADGDSSSKPKVDHTEKRTLVAYDEDIF